MLSHTWSIAPSRHPWIIDLCIIVHHYPQLFILSSLFVWITSKDGITSKTCFNIIKGSVDFGQAEITLSEDLIAAKVGDSWLVIIDIHWIIMNRRNCSSLNTLYQVGICKHKIIFIRNNPIKVIRQGINMITIAIHYLPTVVGTIFLRLTI